jgi:hypothetical protein
MKSNNLKITFTAEYILDEDESMDDIEDMMYHACNTVINDNFLTGHGNLASDVSSFDFKLSIE